MRVVEPRVDDGFCWIEEPACDGDPAGALDAAFMPSTDWSQGGPIIEAERIHIAAPAAGEHEWKAHIVRDATPADRSRGSGQGETLLIAAMRAYVESRWGEDVSDTSS